MLILSSTTWYSDSQICGSECALSCVSLRNVILFVDN